MVTISWHTSNKTPYHLGNDNHIDCRSFRNSCNHIMTLTITKCHKIKSDQIIKLFLLRYYYYYRTTIFIFLDLTSFSFRDTPCWGDVVAQLFSNSFHWTSILFNSRPCCCCVKTSVKFPTLCVPRSTQPSSLHEMVKWVSAFMPSNNTWR